MLQIPKPRQPGVGPISQEGLYGLVSLLSSSSIVAKLISIRVLGSPTVSR